MAFTPDALEAAVGAVGDLATTVSLHTADPGTTGAAEAAGGGYARQAVTWSGDGGELTGTPATFDVAAGNYTHVGVWAENDVFVGGLALDEPTGDLPDDVTVTVTPTIRAE